MSKSLKAPYIRELILPFVGRQFACIVQPMGGWSGSKNQPLLRRNNTRLPHWRHPNFPAPALRLEPFSSRGLSKLRNAP